MHWKKERAHVFAAVAVVGLVALGCRKGGESGSSDKETKEYVDSQLPAARTKLASVKSITQKAVALPPLQKDGAYTGPAVSADFEDLGSLAFTFKVGQDVPFAIHTPDPFAGVKKAVDGDDPRFVSLGEAKSEFADVKRLDYLLVAKAIAQTKPVVESTGFFKPGHLVGEGHLFAVDGEKYIGGFRFEAKTSDSIKVKATTNQLTSKAQDELESDFDNQAREAMKAALQKFGGGKVTLSNLL